MKSRGITVWDVLLALAVVAVIVTFLVPVTAGDKQKMMGECWVNLKQVGLASMLYSTDHDDRFPHRDSWMTALNPYTKNLSVFRCPQVQKPEVRNVFGYAFNAELSNKSLNKISAPQTPFVYDSLNLGWNASDPLTSLPDPPRHEGVNHILYSDTSMRAVR